MNRPALQLLSEKLKTVVPADRFNLAEWFQRPVFKDIEQPCGFAGCAVGWACVMPEFNALGLRRTTLEEAAEEEAAEQDVLVGSPIYTDADGEAHNGWYAVTRLFGLWGNEADYLFLDSCYDTPTDANGVPETATPLMVAARIDEVLAHGFPDNIGEY